MQGFLRDFRALHLNSSGCLVSTLSGLDLMLSVSRGESAFWLL